MIRGHIATAVLLAVLLGTTSSNHFEQIEITKANRIISLTGAYATENIKISFVSNEDGIDHFTYLSPFEYDSKVSKIWFTKSEKDRNHLGFSKTIFTYVPLP
ncbi:MAG: hypothetical protein KDD45_07980 [Bdellovibrionales bacterium]|nr:hypothetical protein [Bdellovibrionales bacterium]